MGKKKYTSNREYEIDLDAMIMPDQATPRKKAKSKVAAVLKITVGMLVVALLANVVLWMLFPSVVEKPVPAFMYAIFNREEENTGAIAADTRAEASDEDKNCQVKMTVEMNGKILSAGKTYKVKSGDEIHVSAFSTEAEIERIGYYSNMNIDIRDTYDNDITILLPEYKKGTKVQLFIEAIATNDDGSANTVTKTGWKKYILEY